MTDINKPYGRFTLKTLVGKGSFGEVYKAYDPQLQRDVALKVLHQGLMVDASFVTKAQKEASLVQRIQHPNVVKILEVGGADGRSYIEMEYIDGQPLSEILKSGVRYSMVQIVNLIEQVASALDATHAQKVIHRDVKPANILIDKAGRAHLVDFGLAHAAKSSIGSSSTAAGIGTAMYMSPEQAAGQAGDKTTDVYSLGIVAYELLTGRLPFVADNLPGYIDAHRHQRPPEPRKINPGISKEIQQVLLKALSKDPGSRFKSTGEFAAALHRASEKPASGKGKLVGCLAAAIFFIFVVMAVGAWSVLFGPFREQASEGLANILPGSTSATRVSDMFASNTPEVTGTNLPVSASATNAPTAMPLPTETAQSTAVPSEGGAPANPPVPENTKPPVPSLTPTNTMAPTLMVGDLPILIGTGVSIEVISGHGTGILVRLMDGYGQPKTGSYVKAFTQKKDLAGQWVVDQNVKSDYTDNSGQVFFELSPGGYIIGTDFTGYNWGTAGDKNGQANVVVEAGKATQLTVALGRLTIGFLNGDGSVITGQYVKASRQKKDIAGKWVVEETVATGYTDNSGLVGFDLTPGYYILSSGFSGYNWGSANDVMGMASVAVEPGKENRQVISLGQLQVGLLDYNGNPVTGQYVKVFMQKTNVSGNSSTGDNIKTGYTDNTGLFVANLTPGKYAVQVNDQTLLDIEVAAGRVTSTNGATWQFK